MMTTIESVLFQLREVGKRWPLFIILILTILSLHLALTIGSAATGRPHQDEGWIANPALNLGSAGFMGTTVLDPVSGFGMDNSGRNMPLPGIDQYTYYLTPLEIVALAGWFKVLGFGLFRMRAFSILWAVVALFAWFEIMKALTANRRVALLTFMFIALDVHFILRSAHGRMDMMSAALGFSALASYLNLRQRNLLAAVLLSQALTVASGLTHPNGGVITFAGLTFLMIYFDRRRIKFRELALALTPYLVGLIGWGLYILKAPSAFLSQFTVNATGGGRLGAFLHPWNAVVSEISVRYLANYGTIRNPGQPLAAALLSFVLLVYLAAVIGALLSPRIRAHKGYFALLLLTVIVFAILTFFEGRKDVWYLVYITPLLDAVTAVWIYEGWTNRWFPRWAIAVVMAGFLGLQVMGVCYRIKQNPYQNRFLPVVEYLQTHGNSNFTLFGNPEFGFKVGFDNLKDDIWLGYFSSRRPTYIVMEERYLNVGASMRRKDPEFDQYVSHLLTEEYQLVAEPTPYCKIYKRR